MPRQAKITYPLVKKIADDLYAETRLIPTIDSVKEKLREEGHGQGGSNTTIAAFLRQWRRETGLTPEEAPPIPLSDPITEAVRNIQAKLTEEANQRIAQAEAKAQEQVDVAQASERIAQQNLESANRQIAELRDALSGSQDQLNTTREQLAAERTARDHAERLSQSTAEQVKNLEMDLLQTTAQARVEITMEREQTEKVRKDLEDRIAGLQADIDRDKTDHAEKARLWAHTEGRLNAVIESERDKLATTNGKLQELRSERQTEIAKYASTIDGLNKLLSDRDSTISDLREKLSGLSSTLEASNNRVQQLEGERRLDQVRMTDLEQMISKGQDIIAQLQQEKTNKE